MNWPALPANLYDGQEQLPVSNAPFAHDRSPPTTNQLNYLAPAASLIICVWRRAGNLTSNVLYQRPEVSGFLPLLPTICVTNVLLLVCALMAHKRHIVINTITATTLNCPCRPTCCRPCYCITQQEVPIWFGKKQSSPQCAAQRACLH